MMKQIAPNSMIQNRYLVVQSIGKGGMGEVYLAVDQRLGSAVALKRTYFEGNSDLGNAFEREAKILARLRHPVLPKVIDHFVESDGQFLVMEHITGEDLAKRLEVAGKPFPLSWVMYWSDQLLDALNYLHSHEPPIIHRDIKPQNLKLTDDNQIVLLDFGLSKDFDSVTTGGSSGVGSIVGYSPGFAPMEQVRGTGTDARSDLYSLSATLYQMLTNRVPSDALARADGMLGGSGDPLVSISELNPEVTERISNVILKGVSVRKEDRYDTAGEMQKELRRAYNSADAPLEAVSSGGTNEAKTAVFPGNAVDTNPNTRKMERPDESTQTGSAKIAAPSSGESAKEARTAVMSIPPAETEASVETLAFDENTLEMAAASPTVEPSQVGIETAIMPGGIQMEKPVLPVHDVTKVLDSEAVMETEVAVPPGNIIEPSNQTRIANSESTVPQAEAAPLATAASASGGVAAHSSPQPAAFVPQSPTAAAVKKKGSSSKLPLVIGALFAFFVLAAVAGGAGWYVYTNMDRGAGVAEAPAASPTPEAPVIAEATPETAAIDSDEPSANTEETMANTAAETTDDSNRSTATSPRTAANTRASQPAVKSTPARTPAPAATKATPKPRPRDDRTVILQ